MDAYDALGRGAGHPAAAGMLAEIRVFVGRPSLDNLDRLSGLFPQAHESGCNIPEGV